jgi:hypothetical protein
VVTGDGTVIQRPEDECVVAAPAVKATVTAAPTRSMNIIRVLDGRLQTLDCTIFLGTTLVLPSGDRVVIPCPITGEASLVSIESDELPEALDSGLAFVSGMDVLVSPSLDGFITVDFVIPSSQEAADLVILRWDLTAWTELPGIRTVEDFYEARSNRDGVFVLASR